MTWLAGLLDRFARWYIGQVEGLLDGDVIALRSTGATRYAWFVEELKRQKLEYTETKKAGNIVIIVKIRGKNGGPGMKLRFKFKEKK